MKTVPANDNCPMRVTCEDTEEEKNNYGLYVVLGVLLIGGFLFMVIKLNG